MERQKGFFIHYFPISENELPLTENELPVTENELPISGNILPLFQFNTLFQTHSIQYSTIYEIGP